MVEFVHGGKCRKSFANILHVMSKFYDMERSFCTKLIVLGLRSEEKYQLGWIFRKLTTAWDFKR